MRTMRYVFTFVAVAMLLSVAAPAFAREEGPERHEPVAPFVLAGVPASVTQSGVYDRLADRVVTTGWVLVDAMFQPIVQPHEADNISR